MSTQKPIPQVDLNNLVPPYKNYKYFVDGEGKPLTVGSVPHSFKSGSKSFAMVNAWWLAEASTLVYDEPDFVANTFKSAGLPDMKLFDKGDTQCFVASNNDLVVVAFRGSETGMRRGDHDFQHIFNDLATNSNFKMDFFDENKKRGRVHSGFKKAIDEVWKGSEGLAAYLARLKADGRSRTFWFTGHSLGAALATLAVAKCDALQGFDVHGLYNYGSPLVGDADFKNYFGGVLKKFQMEHYRFVDDQDIITVIPPDGFGYRHVGSLRLIKPNGEISGGIGAMDGFLNFLSGVFRRAFDSFGTVNSRVVRFIPDQLRDHVPTIYATRIWNAHARETA